MKEHEPCPIDISADEGSRDTPVLIFVLPCIVIARDRGGGLRCQKGLVHHRVP